MMNFINLGVSGVIVVGRSSYFQNNLLLLPILYIGLLAVQLVCFLWLNRHHAIGC